VRNSSRGQVTSGDPAGRERANLGRTVAPIAGWIADELWTTVKKTTRLQLPATRLTQSHRREARGLSADLTPNNTSPKPVRVCRGCGASVKRDSDYYVACGLVISTDKIREVGEAGRVAAQTAHAQAGRAETQRRNAIAQQAWKSSNGPRLSEETYKREIQPRLHKLSISAIGTALRRLGADACCGTKTRFFNPCKLLR
jgi:hypothetical protein